jgi:DNA-binding IscR family transcriptional regulator
MGFAVYAALHLLRFKAPREHRAAFFCSGQNISKHSGISVRRVWDPLRRLETASLVTIERPAGKNRLAHGASKISLLPVFTKGNKVGDAASLPAATDSHSRNCHEVGTELAHIEESPSLTGMGTHAAASDTALVRAVSAADASGEVAPITNLRRLAKQALGGRQCARYTDLIKTIVAVEKVSKPTADRRIKAMLASGVLDRESYYYKLPGTVITAPIPQFPKPSTPAPAKAPAPAPTPTPRPAPVLPTPLDKVLRAAKAAAKAEDDMRTDQAWAESNAAAQAKRQR